MGMCLCVSLYPSSGFEILIIICFCFVWFSVSVFCGVSYFLKDVTVGGHLRNSQKKVLFLVLSKPYSLAPHCEALVEPKMGVLANHTGQIGDGCLLSATF